MGTVHSSTVVTVSGGYNQYKPNSRIMAYSWDNRVKFVVRYMYDIDNNGFLDKNDFECLAVRNTVIEGKGEWNDATFKKNQEVMANLWNEIAELADFNKDGDGTVGLTEFRVDCVNRMAYKSIKELDDAYAKLLNDDDKKAGGISLARYQELYAQFIGNPDETCPAVNLFGPLTEIA